jgi:TrpR-related protein YerC/YecD
MSDDIKNAYSSLFEVILSLKTQDECQAFFNDLCTVKELDSMAQRVKVAKMLKDGKTYEQIIAQTDISSATLSRVSRSFKYGNGYKKFV